MSLQATRDALLKQATGLGENVDQVREEELRKEAERKRLEEEAARIVEEIVVPKSILPPREIERDGPTDRILPSVRLMYPSTPHEMALWYKRADMEELQIQRVLPGLLAGTSFGRDHEFIKHKVYNVSIHEDATSTNPAKAPSQAALQSTSLEASAALRARANRNKPQTPSTPLRPAIRGQINLTQQTTAPAPPPSQPIYATMPAIYADPALTKKANQQNQLSKHQIAHSHHSPSPLSSVTQNLSAEDLELEAFIRDRQAIQRKCDEVISVPATTSRSVAGNANAAAPENQKGPAPPFKKQLSRFLSKSSRTNSKKSLFPPANTNTLTCLNPEPSSSTGLANASATNPRASQALRRSTLFATADNPSRRGTLASRGSLMVPSHTSIAQSGPSKSSLTTRMHESEYSLAASSGIAPAINQVELSKKHVSMSSMSQSAPQHSRQHSTHIVHRMMSDASATSGVDTNPNHARTIPSHPTTPKSHPPTAQRKQSTLNVDVESVIAFISENRWRLQELCMRLVEGGESVLPVDTICDALCVLGGLGRPANSTLPTNLAMLTSVKGYKGSLKGVSYSHLRSAVLRVSGSPGPMINFNDLLAQRAIVEEMQSRILTQRTHLKTEVAESDITPYIHRQIASAMIKGDDTEWVKESSEPKSSIPKQTFMPARKGSVTTKKRVSVFGRKPSLAAPPPPPPTMATTLSRFDRKFGMSHAIQETPQNQDMLTQSDYRRHQVDELEHVAHALEQAGLNIPRRKLERALLIPQCHA